MICFRTTALIEPIESARLYTYMCHTLERSVAKSIHVKIVLVVSRRTYIYIYYNLVEWDGSHLPIEMSLYIFRTSACARSYIIRARRDCGTFITPDILCAENSGLSRMSKRVQYICWHSARVPWGCSLDVTSLPSCRDSSEEIPK